MKYTLLGKQTGLFVSEMALGTANFGTANGYGAAEDEARRIFDAYTERGGNFFDTSNLYQQGEAERMLGVFMEGKRHDYVVATKYARGYAVATTGNHRKAMRAAVEESLVRLKTDYIDLYLAHFDDRITPLEEIARGLEELVSSGKVLYTGLSNFSPWRTAAIHQGLTAIQIEYNLLQRQTEQEYLPMAEELGLAVMGYSPMAGGLLTGKYRKGEEGRLTLMKGKTDHAILDVVLAVAEETGATPGQVAIAWTRTKGVLPIIGARTLAQFEECVGAATLVLSAEHLQLLEDASRTPLMYPNGIDISGLMPHVK